MVRLSGWRSPRAADPRQEPSTLSHLHCSAAVWPRGEQRENKHIFYIFNTFGTFCCRKEVANICIAPCVRAEIRTWVVTFTLRDWCLLVMALPAPDSRPLTNPPSCPLYCRHPPSQLGTLHFPPPKLSPSQRAFCTVGQPEELMTLPDEAHALNKRQSK
ncbi:hypothetical protein MHYP_G00232490 [Metynnis hypsauchen]